MLVSDEEFMATVKNKFLSLKKIQVFKSSYANRNPTLPTTQKSKQIHRRKSS